MTDPWPNPTPPLSRWIPPLEWLRGYDENSIRADVTAGLTAAAVVVPQAMAYAAIAGLPLVTGLYTSFVPLVVYAVVGTSRPLSVTTTSTLAILTASALARVVSGTDNDQLILAAATLAFLVGVILVISSFLRLGVVASFISEPVLVGFKAGVGLTIVVDQIPKLLGVQFVKGSFIHNITSIANHLPHVSAPTLLLGMAMLVLLIGMQKFLPRWPASLIVVAAGIILSVLLALDHHGVALVGSVKGGLPSVSMPELSLLQDLWPAALGIALMSFVETAAAGQAFRYPDEPRPDANNELLAIGLTNIIGGLFQNMPSGGGTSQTAVNRRAGARTQIASLVTAAVVAAVLFFLSPVVHWMPQATLAAVVVVPCAGMIRLRDFRDIYQVRAMEFSWAIASVIGVLALGTLRGIIVAIALSLLGLSYHANMRPVFVLGRKPGTDVFRPLSPEHPEDQTFPGLLILKTEGVIHFANAQFIGNEIWPLIYKYKPRVLVLDCSAIPDFEYTAMKMLIDAEKRLQRTGITLWLAALNPEPLRLVQNSELGKTLGRQRMFFNLEQAVFSFQKQSAELLPTNKAMS